MRLMPSPSRRVNIDDGDRRQQRTSERKFKRREFSRFDEEAAGAPKDRGDEDEQQRRDLFSVGCRN